MLRKVVLGIALLLAVVGLWLVSRHVWVPGLQLLIVAALVFLGTAFESWRYRKGPAPPGAQWKCSTTRCPESAATCGADQAAA